MQFTINGKTIVCLCVRTKRGCNRNLRPLDGAHVPLKNILKLLQHCAMHGGLSRVIAPDQNRKALLNNRCRFPAGVPGSLLAFWDRKKSVTPEGKGLPHTPLLYYLGLMFSSEGDSWVANFFVFFFFCFNDWLWSENDCGKLE